MIGHHPLPQLAECRKIGQSMFPERRNMTIDIAPTKNPAAGWDITTSIATTAQAEKVTRVRIQINDFPEYDKAIDPPADFWKNTLIQQGVYPGNNRVVVTATNNQGNDTVAINEWS